MSHHVSETHLTSDHRILHLRSHYTLVCFGTTISHHHISKHMIHITQPRSTSHTIPHPQLFHTYIQHHGIFHTTYSTSHYTNTSHHFPHLTSHNTLHMPHSAGITTVHIASVCIMQHSTYQGTTFHATLYSISHTFCISIRHHVWNCNIPHRTTFDVYWHHTTFHIAP